MSAFGPKQTLAIAVQMSAFGGKADMPFALHMSANDPKRTSRGSLFGGSGYRCLNSSYALPNSANTGYLRVVATCPRILRKLAYQLISKRV